MNSQNITEPGSIAGAASRAGEAGANLTAVLEAGGGWSRSLIEEVIGCLWLITAVLAFGFGFDALGWFCAIKAATDQCMAIFYTVKEIKAEEKASNVEVTGAARLYRAASVWTAGLALRSKFEAHRP